MYQLPNNLSMGKMYDDCMMIAYVRGAQRECAQFNNCVQVNSVSSARSLAIACKLIVYRVRAQFGNCVQSDEYAKAKRK